MPAGVAIPYTFTAGQVADADQVNANFQALAAKFGGIVDGDIAAGADIDANKLSSTAGKRVPETRMENNAASSRVVASDSNSPGSDANRAVSGDHIKLLTGAQLDRILPETPGHIGTDKLADTYHAVAFSTGVMAQIGGIAYEAAPTANPSVAFPKATYDLVGMYVKNQTTGDAQAAMTPIADDTGTNWAGKVHVVASLSNSVAATLVYVFRLKVTS